MKLGDLRTTAVQICECDYQFAFHYLQTGYFYQL